MKIPKVVNQIGHIDDELIDEAVAFKKNKRLKFKPLAACVALVLTLGIFIATFFINAANTSPIDERFKNLEFTSLNTARVWEWEYLAESERNYEAEINGIKYGKSSGQTVNKEFIGEKIGNFDIFGYDGIMILNDERVTVNCDVYKIKNVDQAEFVAIKIGEDYYSFQNSKYNPPETLGELFQKINLSEFLELSRFSKNKNESEQFLLNDDKYLWDILLNCKSAEFVNWDPFNLYQREHISFTVSCEALGVHKNSFSVTKDGYLYTNVFGWSYLYDIGKDAAEKIIKYAKENSVKTEYVPYDENKNIYGEVIEIANDYILVDDSVFCKNKNKGITYKILTDDIRVSRYVDSKTIIVGNTVMVSYSGEIDEAYGHTVSKAFKISKIIIVDNNKKKLKNNSQTVSSVSHTIGN